MAPEPDDDVSMAEVADAGSLLDALAAAVAAPGVDSTNPGMESINPAIVHLLALQASTRQAEVAREELRRPVQAAAAALDALAQGRGQAIPEVAALAALRASIDRPVAATPSHPVRRHNHTRNRRRRVVATLALAAVFSAGGVTAAAAASHPGDQLYPLRVAVIGRVDSDPVVSSDVLDEASSALAATAPGAGASSGSAAGASPSADASETVRSEKLLAQAAALVPKVKDPRVRQQLVARLAALTATLHRRIADQAPPVAVVAAQPSGTPPPEVGPTVSTPASPKPVSTPGARHRRHPVVKHRPSPQPTRTARSPRPTPSPSVTPSAAPTPTMPTPKPTRTKKSPSASPTTTACAGPTATASS